MVIDLISELRDDFKAVIYMDNFFTSLKLLDELSNRDFGGVGTIRKNRTEKAPLTDQKLVVKKNRGHHETIYDSMNHISLCQWHDNNVVIMASNCFSAEPLTTAKRWSSKEKKTIFINQPDVVSRYNGNMGGVDRLDQNLSSYRVSIRKKKWWFPIFSWLLGVSVNNAWQLYRLSISKFCLI